MKSLRYWQVYFAIVTALGICVATGLITNWGQWYSGHTAYRRQTDAFFTGHLRLSTSPATVEHDFAWAEGGVQQLWGLGVPTWRFPFECLAKIMGQPAFPDRLAFATALALVAYILQRALFTSEKTDNIRGWLKSITEHPERLAAVALLALFPPMLALYRGPFTVYEEAVAYGYLYGIGLFAGLVIFRSRPTLTLYLALTFLASLAVFIRATMLAYGGATMLLAFLYTRLLGWKWRASASGWCLFAVGCSLLYWTNRVRFGSGTEFGQALQLSSLDLMYVSRFHAPFSDSSLWLAVKELIGSLFAVKRLNGFDVYASDIVLWQSPTLRWRHFYDTTYDLSYPVFLVGAFNLIAWGTLRPRKVFASLRQPTNSCLAGTWAVVSLIPLALFYSRFFVISSRYMLDFAPAFAVAMAGGLLEWGTISAVLGKGRKLVVVFALVALVGWGGWEVASAQFYFPQETPLSQDQVLHALRRQHTMKSLPDNYEAGMNPAGMSGIFHNGKGWFGPSGETGSMVVLFVSNPERIILDVAPASGTTLSEQDYADIHAKVGLESLHLNQIESTTTGKRLIFDGPRRSAYRNGAQVLFISFVPPANFTRERSSFRLLQVRWNQSEPPEIFKESKT